MFLANLTGEQKAAFLVLAQTLIAADDVLSDDEVSMMEQYKQEMAFPASMNVPRQSVEQCTEVFKAGAKVTKKQIIFELVALACADNDYADEEHHFLGAVSTALGLDAAFLGECRAYVRELTALYERIGKLIGE